MVCLLLFRKKPLCFNGLDLPIGPNFLGTHPSGSGCSLYFPFSSCTTGKCPTEWKPPAPLMISAKQAGLKLYQMCCLSLWFHFLKEIKLVRYSYRKYVPLVNSCCAWGSSQASRFHWFGNTLLKWREEMIWRENLEIEAF